MRRSIQLSATFVVLTALFIGDGLVVRATAQGKKDAGRPTPADVLDTLQIDMKEFQQPMTLREALGLVNEKIAGQVPDFPTLVDVKAFENGAGVYDTQIKFPVFNRLALGQVLDLLVNQLPGHDATYRVRKHWIEITTVDQLVPNNQKVRAKFVNVPLADALRELSEQTGIGIVLDARAANKGKEPMTATFPPNTNLVTAAALLADMAGLKLRVVDRILYVTTPTNQADIVTGDPAGM